MTRAAVTALILGICLVVPYHAAEKKASFAADKGSKTVDVSEYSEEMQEYYKAYSRRCSKCHTLARSINTRLSTSAWKRYVKRMANREGSGIPPKDAKKIYLYLKYREQKLAADAASNSDDKKLSEEETIDKKPSGKNPTDKEPSKEKPTEEKPPEKKSSDGAKDE